MMSGALISLHAVISIVFQISDVYLRDLEFVIDTGFTGYLTLPIHEVEALGLPFVYFTRAHLADHSEIRLPVHEGIILWDGQEVKVSVLATGERPLLGTSLLDEHELLVRFIEGGLVSIKRI